MKNKLIPVGIIADSETNIGTAFIPLTYSVTVTEEFHGSTLEIDLEQFDELYEQVKNVKSMLSE